MRWTRVMIFAALVGLTIGSWACAAPIVSAAPERDPGTLALNAQFQVKFAYSSCPAGTASTTACYQVSSSDSPVPGLGQANDSYLGQQDSSNPTCPHSSWQQVTITVVGKGTITATLSDTYTCDPSLDGTWQIPFTVTGGTGLYAGAAGSGTLTQSLRNGLGTNSWSGTVTAPNVTFDLTPPVISGATSKVVRLKKGHGSARVKFSVTATDSVDGTIPVTCSPPSGSVFTPGKTPVTCTATDSNGNTAEARFTIKVKRYHH